MLFDLDSSINVKMFGKCTHESGFWHDQVKQKQSDQFISTNCLLFITDGWFNIRILGSVYQVHEGDTVLIPANTSYQPLESDGCTYYFFHFSGTVVDTKPTEDMDRVLLRFVELENESGYVYNFYGKMFKSIVEIPIHTSTSSYSSHNKIADLFGRAAKLNIWQNISEKMLLDNIMRELLIIISTSLNAKETNNNTLQKILHYIKRNYEKPLSLSDLSATFGISTSYISKLFKTHLNMGTTDYINDLRLSAACELLISSDDSIGRISDKVGYNNQYYFDRLFRRKFGMTPKEFRKANYIMRP